ncbi:hypothetical protein SISSUDRAFT_1054163 [Sistotremastrum suecicum HHB10207 ss-3]|uniref:Uncharacterized protein n=1 Tax=Sistotremastrum suecicum HHB10207 ss-3 TaxID=1314776 RepID=A0A165YPX0_9AGAM|nr:hypothetical protein SISSUDRAFT_1054163 [Sistotremastrum suecicum HHB10207 ss-3]
MGRIFDFVSLIFTIVFFVGIIYGAITIARIIDEAVHSTKETLKSKGLHVTDSGVAVKTKARMDREDYIDKTQAALINSMKYASFGDGTTSSPVSSATTGGGTYPNGSDEEKKRKGRVSNASRTNSLSG